jgi:hypothetical protein
MDVNVKVNSVIECVYLYVKWVVLCADIYSNSLRWCLLHYSANHARQCFDKWQWSKLRTVLGHYLFCYRYWVFRSWGRIGTTIGGKKLEIKHNKWEARRQFECVYAEKTGNSWYNKNFRKFAGCFFPIDLDYDQVNLYCVCIWWFADSCNPKSGRCRNTVFKKINAPSDNVMTFGMFRPSFFLTGSIGCAVALDIKLNFMGN